MGQGDASKAGPPRSKAGRTEARERLSNQTAGTNRSCVLPQCGRKEAPRSRPAFDAARRWFDAVLKPANCSSARIAYLPPWTAGIMSSIWVYTSFVMLAVEHGYTVVPIGEWKFARGLSPPTHEHYFQPLSGCVAEAAARLKRPGSVTDTRFTRGNSKTVKTTQHTDDFLRLVKEWTPAVRLVTLRLKRGWVNFPFKFRHMKRTLAFAQRHGLTFIGMFASLLQRIATPRPWLHEQLQQQAATAATAACWAFAPAYDAALHLRLAEFHHDRRAPVELNDFVTALSNSSQDRVVYVASDTPNITKDLEQVASMRASGARLRFISHDAVAWCGSSCQTKHLSAEDVVTRMDSRIVRRITTDALIDMFSLVAAPEYVGSDGNWAGVVLMLRHAYREHYFIRSKVLYRFNRAKGGSGITQSWQANDVCLNDSTACRTKEFEFVKLWSH